MGLELHDMAEFLRLIHAQSYARPSDTRWNLTGHIADYNPETGGVTAVVPIMTDDGTTYIQTPEIPLGTMMAGNGFGIQYYPVGGATITNPTNGEEVHISLGDPERGTPTQAAMLFNQTLQVPPSQDLLNGTVSPVPPGNGGNAFAPGEFLVRHQSGSYIRFYSNGDIQTVAANNLIMQQQGGSSFEIFQNGNVNIVSMANITLEAAGLVTIIEG